MNIFFRNTCFNQKTRHLNYVTCYLTLSISTVYRRFLAGRGTFLRAIVHMASQENGRGRPTNNMWALKTPQVLQTNPALALSFFRSLSFSLYSLVHTHSALSLSFYLFLSLSKVHSHKHPHSRSRSCFAYMSTRASTHSRCNDSIVDRHVTHMQNNTLLISDRQMFITLKMCNMFIMLNHDMSCV